MEFSHIISGFVLNFVLKIGVGYTQLKIAKLLSSILIKIYKDNYFS